MTTQQTDIKENIDINEIEKRLELLFCAISNSNNKNCRVKARNILSTTKEKGLYEKYQKNSG